MKRLTTGRILLGACMLWACLACGGCLVNSSAHVSYGEAGPPVSDETLAKVKPGETPRAWLLSVLGEPARTEKIDDETELLVYDYVKKEQASFCVLVLLGTSAKNEKHTTLYFELRRGVVQRYWRDRRQGRA